MFLFYVKYELLRARMVFYSPILPPRSPVNFIDELLDELGTSLLEVEKPETPGRKIGSVEN